MSVPDKSNEIPAVPLLLQMLDLVDATLTLFVSSSREPKVRETARLLWGHWGIENSRHYVLDVVFAEDAGRIRKGSSRR